jgi:hypothetical protein
MKRRIGWSLFLLSCAVVTLFVLRPGWIPGGDTLTLKLHGRSTISDRVSQYGSAARARLIPSFTKAGISYPPQKVVLVGLKREKRLELYAAGADEKLKFIRDYKVLAASGDPGPKLEEGDGQVPEGFYKIESLNPNSAFHLTLRVNYPNQYDRDHAAIDGRRDLGSDIMIHGSHGSNGCLAMGDPVSEELFVLAADVGLENIEILLCPVVFRQNDTYPPPKGAPQWTGELYKNLESALSKLKHSEPFASQTDLNP